MNDLNDLKLADLPEYRRFLNLTQADVGKRMQTVQPAVARLERWIMKGKLPTFVTLQSYVNALGLELDLQIRKKEAVEEQITE